MSLYAIGDLHLSFGTDKPMDIFTGWDNYTQKLEKNWKKLVRDNDTVVIDGDISWAMNYEEALPDFQWIDALPGKKILIKGNHDLWWDTMNKNRRFTEENNLETIDFIYNSSIVADDVAVCGTRSWFFDDESDGDKKILNREVGRLTASIEKAKETGKEPIVFLHYPPLTRSEECEEITNILRKEKITRCYYAHMHGFSTSFSFNSEKYGINFRLISSDYLSFCPYLVKK